MTRVGDTNLAELWVVVTEAGESMAAAESCLTAFT